MSWTQSFDTEIAHALPLLKVQHDEPMYAHTTFRVGGPARRAAWPSSVEELTALLTLAEEHGWPTLVVGNGSNLLAADEGLDRLVILTGGLTGLTLAEDTVIRAEAGLSLARLAVFALHNGLTGLEFAHGIPGSLGGAVCMNAGAYGGEMCRVVRSVTAWFPGEGVRTLTNAELDFSYRHSLFSLREGVVLGAELALTPGSESEIRALMEDLIRRRREKQPLEYPSAGSTFKRPTGHFAGALIEQCGLKGFRIGGACVSEKHAGFVINVGGATCADIKAVMDHVRGLVLERTGVELEPEVRLVGP